MNFVVQFYCFIRVVLIRVIRVIRGLFQMFDCSFAALGFLLTLTGGDSYLCTDIEQGKIHRS